MTAEYERRNNQPPQAPGEGITPGSIAAARRNGALDMPTGQVRTVFEQIVGGNDNTLFGTDPYTLPKKVYPWDMDEEIRKFEALLRQPNDFEIEDEAREVDQAIRSGAEKVKTDGSYSMIFETTRDRSRKPETTLSSKKQKRLRKKANKMAKVMRKKSQAETHEVKGIKDDYKAETRWTRASEYRMINGKLVKTAHLKEKKDKSWFYSQAKEVLDGIAPVLNKATNLVPAKKTPEPLTTRQRLISMAATFITGSVALVQPFSLKDDKSASEAAQPSNRPPASEIIIEGSLAPLGGKVQEHIEAPFKQEIGKLVYPSGINPEIFLSSTQLPENPKLYRFMSLQDEGENGIGQHDTPPQERYGNTDLLGVINTVALAYNAKYKNPQLIVADLTAPGHASHKKNIDVDFYLDDNGLKIGSRKYDKDRAVDLGIMLMKTGKIDLIIFNDNYVIEKVNQYAIDNNLSGRMFSEGKHDKHMHIRIKEREAKIEIPWMPQEVRRWDNLILQKSKKYGVDPEFVSIIMYKESAGNPKAGSGVGAQGLMQIMPETAKGIAAELGVKEYDIWDPETNIDFGVYYLGQLLKLYGKLEHGPSWDLSVIITAIGYNGGPGAADGYISGRVKTGQGPYCESREYAYYVVGMWRERHQMTSKYFDELNTIGHRCNSNPASYPISSLV